MNELSPGARALLALTRQVDGPDVSAKRRGRAALMGSLASGAVMTTTGAAQAILAGTGGASLGIKAALVSVLGPLLIGGAAGLVVAIPAHRAWLSRPPSPPPPPVESSSGESAPERGLPHALPSAPADRGVWPSASAPAPGETVRPAPSRPNHAAAPNSDTSPNGDAPPDGATLAEETRLLHEAQAALAAGDPARSLSLVREHERRFKRGTLREEGRAAHALALCAAARWAEGRAAVAQFEREFPDSPLVQRVRRGCTPGDGAP